MSKATVKIGDKFNTKYGICEVVDYKNCENVFVKFLNTGGITKTNTTDLRRDSVRDYYAPSIANIGYFGQGDYKARINNKITREYQAWSGMINRCYDKKFLEREPSYKICTVCKEWHNFQVFAKWMLTKSNYQEGWQLDKDLKNPNSKIYCPENCLFIPKELNKALVVNRNSDKNTCRGVKLVGQFYLVNISINGKTTYFGSYNTEQEASEVYKEKKLAYLNSLAEKYNYPETITRYFYDYVYNNYLI